MKHLWALLSALVLTAAIAVTGVAAWAASTPASSTSAHSSSPEDASSLSSDVAASGFFWHLTPPQQLLAGTFLLARGGAHHASHQGTRSDKQFFEISSTGGNDVPEAALRAYHHAETVMASVDPSCHISWTLLAAIGRVESNHGRFGGSQLGSDGISRPAILGPQLNGSGAFAAIRDTDHGVLDHDKVWDRAVGQMQFLPQTWRSVARDGNGDGKMNPNDINDSALGSAVYLCGAGGSLADQAGMARAAFRYNHSDYYVQLVLSFVAGYQTGVFALPSPPPPADAKTTTARPSSRHPHNKHTNLLSSSKPTAAVPAGGAISKPAPKPTPTSGPTSGPKSGPGPSSTPSPKPTGPNPVRVDGTLTACGPNFCLDGTVLDLGSPAVLGNRAAADMDGDGTTESNADEFAGLVGTQVTLQVEHSPGGLVVYVVNGQGYRNADGSFARTTAPATASPTVIP